MVDSVQEKYSSKTHRQVGLRLAMYSEMTWDSARLASFQKDLGWSPHIFNRAIKGQHDFRLSELLKLAKHFKVPLSKVLTAKF